MAIDRAATLRNAEKLLRQGKVDQAIAEYVRVVDDQPRDWTTANTLGDVYVRAGQIDKAVEQFVRIADHLHGEGFYPKAAAVYKKVLKLKPDHEHSLLRAADIAAEQGLLVEARQGFNAVAERRRARGDVRGVAQMRIRLGTLDPADFAARVDAARARVDIGEADGALADLKALAAELIENGQQEDAYTVIREAAALDPDDQELRQQLLGVYIAAGDFAHAREMATTAEEFKALATALDKGGHADHALAALVEASRLDPADIALKQQLVRAFLGSGDLKRAMTFLTAETAGRDPELRIVLAEARLRAGARDEGVSLLKQLIEEDPSLREAVAFLGWTIAEEDPTAGYPAVEVAADAAVAQSDFASAAAALQEFVSRVPGHIPALMRLVEICVDGGLEATMHAAQAQLADAYIAAGAAAEARFIAEDLVAREPWERANVERFRQALVLLGEPDPDGIIAERLSGESPFMSTELTATDLGDFDDTSLAGQPAAIEPEPIAPPVIAAAAPAPRQQAAPAKPPDFAPAPGPAGRDPFELSANAIDLSSLFGEADGPRRETATAEEAAADLDEIDLSDALEDGGEPEAPAVRHDAPRTLADTRREAADQSADPGEPHYQRGLALKEAGDLDGAIAALQVAARSPRLRFRAATLIARIYRSRAMLPQAIEWFERAAEAPAPNVNEGRFLLYEMADALESAGEVARALAVCLELQADAGDFKDVAARIGRLSKVQTRG